MNENEQEYFEERAAILEFEAGYTRKHAEEFAMKEMERKFRTVTITRRNDNESAKESAKTPYRGRTDFRNRSV